MVSTLLISKHHRWLNLTSRLSHLAVLQPLLFHKHIYSTNSLLNLVVTERSFMTTLRIVWEGSKFWSGWEDGRKGYMRLGVFRLFQKRHQEWQNSGSSGSNEEGREHRYARSAQGTSPIVPSTFFPPSPLPLDTAWLLLPVLATLQLSGRMENPPRKKNSGRGTTNVAYPASYSGHIAKLCIRRSEENLGDEGCASWNKATGKSEPKYLRFPFRLPLQCFLYPLPSRCYLLNQK